MSLFQKITHRVNELTGSQGVRVYLNHKLSRYGKMLDLKIDSQRKTIRAEVLLAGEKDAIVIDIKGYHLTQDADACAASFEGVSVSRKWIELILADLLAKYPRGIPLPPEYAKYAKLVL